MSHFWFRSIWIDLHQALTIDRASSRDRAPIGLVRCICKDDHVKGKHAHVKFKLSNIHAFVPVWMAPMMLKNFRLIAAQSSPLSSLGQLDYREGWFAIIPKEGQPGKTPCGIQADLSDKSLAEFPNRDWPAIEYWVEKGLLKPYVESTAHQPCLSLLNWKFRSAAPPYKSSSKLSNLTRCLTAGPAIWKVGGPLTMEDWT